MKKSFVSFVTLLGFSIVNSAFFGIVLFLLEWNTLKKDHEFVPYFLPSTIVAILIIIFSMIAKQKGKGGILWLPIILSVPPILLELLFIKSDDDIFLVGEFALILAILYILFRYYFIFHKNNMQSQINL
jgi:hypothetical protein